MASSTAGLTIGTSPYDDSLKRRKKGVAVAVNRPAIASYVPYLDIESRTFVRDLLVYGGAGRKPIDPLPFIQRLSLSLAVTINWGVRIPSVEDPMFREIVAVEEELNRFRSTTGNLQDYIPLLRLNPANAASALAREMRDRRDAYLHMFNTNLKAEVEKGTNRPCIQASVITYKEAALTETELTSISLSMLGGGFETVSTTVQWSVGYFAQHPGIQDRAFEAIREFQGGAAAGGGEVDPLPDAADEQKCAYVNALAKEALRYFTVIPLNLPRESIRDVEYEGVRIPKGTTVYMNAWACNYGEFSHVLSDHSSSPPDLKPIMSPAALCLATRKWSRSSSADLTCQIRSGTMGRPRRLPPRALAREARRAALHLRPRVQDVRRPPPGRQGGVPHLHAAAGELQARAAARVGAGLGHRPGERVQEPEGPDHGAQRVRGPLRAEG